MYPEMEAAMMNTAAATTAPTSHSVLAVRSLPAAARGFMGSVVLTETLGAGNASIGEWVRLRAAGVELRLKPNRGWHRAHSGGGLPARPGMCKAY